MAYRYSAIHNTILHDGNDTDDGVIEDGQRLRVPMTMMDSMQRSIAGSSGTIDDGDVELISRQEMQDWDKAQLSARWKGGLQDGDRVRIGDKNLIVSGRNPTNGKVVLRDASTSVADADADRRNAYVAYDAEIQSRYWRNGRIKAANRTFRLSSPHFSPLGTVGQPQYPNIC